MSWFRSLLLTFATFNAVVAAPPSPPSLDKYLVLYLDDSGVVVMQMQFLTDCQPPRERFEVYVDEFLKELDKNADGKVTMAEARGKIITPQEALQFGIRPDVPSGEVIPMLNPPDGAVTRSSLLTYFKRNGLTPLTVRFESRTTAADSDAVEAPVQSVPLFELLDGNGDRRLSAAELSNALDVLRKLDRDDDETISKAELFPMMQRPQVVPRRGDSAPQPVVPFISQASGESLPKLVRRLIEKYDRDIAGGPGNSASPKNQKLNSQELGLTEKELQKHDKDGDGQLDFTELCRFISSATPTLVVSLNVSDGTVKSVGSDASTVRALDDGSTTLVLGASQINISATRADPSFRVEAASKLLFQELDLDGNEYLEGAEIQDNPFLKDAVSSLDTDENGKIYFDEFVAYIKPRFDVARNRCELLIVEQGRTLFEILDSDRDGRLSHREIRAIAEKLALWDTNADGQLSSEEIPLQYRMIGAEGTLLRSFPSNIATNSSRRSGTTGPTWFQKMDRNRDGEVSKREFLGDVDLFDKIDVNKDGTIDASEARHFKPTVN